MVPFLYFNKLKDQISPSLGNIMLQKITDEFPITDFVFVGPLCHLNYLLSGFHSVKNPFSEIFFLQVKNYLTGE